MSAMYAGKHSLKSEALSDMRSLTRVCTLMCAMCVIKLSIRKATWKHINAHIVANAHKTLKCVIGLSVISLQTFSSSL
jgi:hypothetical protein